MKENRKKYKLIKCSIKQKQKTNDYTPDCSNQIKLLVAIVTHAGHNYLDNIYK